MTPPRTGCFLSFCFTALCVQVFHPDVAWSWDGHPSPVITSLYTVSQAGRRGRGKGFLFLCLSFLKGICAHRHPYPRQTSLSLVGCKGVTGCPSCKGGWESGCPYSGRQQETWELGMAISYTTKCLLQARSLTTPSEDEKNQGSER